MEHFILYHNEQSIKIPSTNFCGFQEHFVRPLFNNRLTKVDVHLEHFTNQLTARIVLSGPLRLTVMGDSNSYKSPTRYNEIVSNETVIVNQGIITDPTFMYKYAQLLQNTNSKKIAIKFLAGAYCIGKHVHRTTSSADAAIYAGIETIINNMFFEPRSRLCRDTYRQILSTQSVEEFVKVVNEIIHHYSTARTNYPYTGYLYDDEALYNDRISYVDRRGYSSHDLDSHTQQLFVSVSNFITGLPTHGVPQRLVALAKSNVYTERLAYHWKDYTPFER